MFSILSQGISEVETDAQASGSEHEEEDVEVLFSCSATGKPPPTIQWSFPEGASPLKPPRSATATNSDHTFTSSSNVSLRVPPDWSGYVDCLLNGGVSSERRERIPISLSPGIKEKDGMC